MLHKIDVKTNSIDIYWDSRILNVLTGIGLVAIPFVAAFFVVRGEVPAAIMYVVMVLSMAGWAWLSKPLLRYDIDKGLLVFHGHEPIDHENVERIEVDVRDIFIIIKKSKGFGVHVKNRGWVISPRRDLITFGAQYGFEVKIIGSPVVRFLVACVPF